MKRYIIPILYAILMILPSKIVQADYVVVTPYISGSDVTISALNNNQNAIVNTLNGMVEGTINIKAGSINTVDLAQAVSPVVRWAESFNSYTYTGMLPVTDATLTSFISAGVSYVNGYRLEVGATAKTYTANRDTFVYINEGGYYQFCEEPNGTDSCGTAPSNALLLAEVITSGTAITNVNDLRTLSIQITTTTTNFPTNYRDGSYVSRDSTVTMHVEPGGIAIGNTIYTRTSDTSTKNVTLGTNWIEGGYAPGGPTTIFVYAYNDAGSTWDFKYSSADPVASDTDGNTNGVLRYYSTGGTNYRAIGWAYLSADTIATQSWGSFNDISAPNYSQVIGTDLRSTSSATYIPIANTRIDFYSTGRPIKFNWSLPIYPSSGTSYVGLFVDGVLYGERAENGAGGTAIYVDSFIVELSKGSHYAELRWKTSGAVNTGDSSNMGEGGRRLNYVEL